MEIKKHLNYALVEDSRPPMYKAMKYWGKKPHNIWQEFIECYCPENGVVLDPFVGSGVAAFESVVSNRRVIAFDINPMSSFFVEVSTARFESEQFTLSANEIIDEIRNDPIYQQHYTKTNSDKKYQIYNYIWKDGAVWKINAKDEDDNPVLFYPNEEDHHNTTSMEDLTIPFWYPQDLFPITPSINGNFIRGIGGNNFSFLWTKRNLYILSYIFEKIQKEPQSVQLPLLYAFVHTLHLVSKMVVSRQERGNRAFSGSWGRADYMIRNRRMEQNPLLVFERACFDKQGVVSALTNANERLSAPVRINEVKRGNGIKARAQINYGKIDVADLLDYIPEKSVDFVITDPPYGGLVQYLDLSLVWLVWLQKYDEKYTPDLSSEITVKRGVVSRGIYKRRLQNAFVNIHKVLKDDGYLVITFHNKEMQEWNDFVNAVRNAGFKFDKVTHQYNRRSGESNVSNPYGTAASDFYIRCVKKRDVDFSDDKSALEHFIYQKTVDVIARRSEPTPYDFILNGVLPELLQAGYLQPEEPTEEINKVLSKYVGDDKVFKVINNPDNKGGSIWWFNEPSKHINYPDIPLSDRVDETVLAILRRQISVKLDDVIAELFKMYPNGLTPDPRRIREVLEKYAYQSSGKWKLKDIVIAEATRHTEIIAQLCHIAKKIAVLSYVGKREQPENLGNGQQLKDIVDYTIAYNRRRMSVQPTPFRYSSTFTYRTPSLSCVVPRYRTVFLVIGPYRCSVMAHFSGSIRWLACSGTISVLCLISKISKDAADFAVRPAVRPENRARELVGYLPWYFHLPSPEKDDAFRQLFDPAGFEAPFGLTTAEQRHPRFLFEHTHECLWNGYVWPYATSQTLTAAVNAIRDHRDAPPLSNEEYYRLLRQYAVSHRLTDDAGRTLDWIDEVIHPFTGRWSARDVLLGDSLKSPGGIKERGKDYNHSTFCDLVLSGLLGLRFENGMPKAEPILPEDWTYFCVAGLTAENWTVLYDKDGTHYGCGAGLQIFRNP